MNIPLRFAVKLLLPISLLACGGGSTGAGSSAPAPVSSAAVTTVGAQAPAPVPAPAYTGALVTDIQLGSTASQGQDDIPVTFGQVFKPGDVAANERLVGVLANGSTIDLQTDVKASHPDGSVRHAIISARLPHLDAQQVLKLSLGKLTTPAASAVATPAALLRAGFTAAVSATIDGKAYTASADQLLASGKYQTWLKGNVVNEWLVSAPLKAPDGSVHPHLSARFAIRAYTGEQRARVDVTVENDWAYEAAPQNFTYKAAVTVGADTVYSRDQLTHFHHARWRKLFWWGAAPQLSIAHNSAYLIATRAVPNYDRSTFFSELNLMALSSHYKSANTEPMGVGLATAYMPTSGGRTDIGLLPGWAATYLLTMDARAREATLGNADLAGSWSAHYRDRNTDRPVSLVDYPYMTLVGRETDTMNPQTKKLEAFPACASSDACTTQNTADGAHQPAFAYLPYLVTGDYYYLEELQFWTMYNLFSSNPGYRGNIKGLLQSDQVRGQAWSLRSLAEAAYITPDADVLKSQFETFLSNNLDWYNDTYPKNSSANALGLILNGPVLQYNDGTGIAPWQDDFFTSAVGHTAELGYAKAQTLLAWKAKFVVSRMTGPGACWIDAAIYSMVVRDNPSSPLYTNIGSAYAASHTPEINQLACGGADMAAALKLRVGEMLGGSSSPTGFPSNMQPALAYAADGAGEAGRSAWQVFANRSVKPNYGEDPQFAIVPR